MEDTELRIYSGTANLELARQIAECLHVQLGNINVERFPDSEVFVQYKDSLRNADIFLIQPTCNPANETLMELLIMIDAAKRASAARITAVIPFYGYARQDRKDRPKVPITAKLVANLLTTAGADRVLAMDLHCQQIQGFFDIPVDHIYAAPVFLHYLSRQAHVDSQAVVVAPDSGSVKTAHSYADKLGCGFAIVAKRRLSATQVESSHLVGDVKGRRCIIFDDMTSTCGTLCGAAEMLQKEGASEVYAVVTHCLLNEKGISKLMNSCIKELVTTNTVPPPQIPCPKLKVLSPAPILAEAIKRIHTGESIACLFGSDMSYMDNLL